MLTPKVMNVGSKRPGIKIILNQDRVQTHGDSRLRTHWLVSLIINIVMNLKLKGTHVHQAAECARLLQRWEQLRELCQRAAECYAEAGRGQAAAEALSKGARGLEEQSPEACSLIMYK